MNDIEKVDTELIEKFTIPHKQYPKTRLWRGMDLLYIPKCIWERERLHIDEYLKFLRQMEENSV